MINAILGEPLVVGLYTGIGSTTLTDRLSSSNNAVLRESVTQAGAPYSDGVSRWSDLLLSDAVSLSEICRNMHHYEVQFSCACIMSYKGKVHPKNLKIAKNVLTLRPFKLYISLFLQIQTTELYHFILLTNGSSAVSSAVNGC